MLTVAELIEILRGYDPNRLVVIPGYEEGWDGVGVVEDKTLVDTHPYHPVWVGRFNPVDDLDGSISRLRLTEREVVCLFRHYEEKA